MVRAFVLSGGASLGAIEAGMVHALYERGIAPDLIVGASAGALNGAYLAARPPTVETALALAEVWRGLSRSLVFPPKLLAGFRGLTGRGDHLFPNTGLRGLIANSIGFQQIEDLKIPLHVIATDLVTGEDKRLSRGPAIEAVLASAAIPGVYPPVEIDGRALVDGGVVNNTPISHAVELGAEEIYVLPTGFACALEAPPRNALGVLLHAETLMTQQRLRLEIELYRDRVKLVVLPPPCPQPVSPIDFSRAEELIGWALRDSREFFHWIAETGDDARANTARLEPHTHASRTPLEPHPHH